MTDAGDEPHEMCRLMIAAGVTPNKVWIFGNLRAASQNNPNCQVFWGWHVAPTLSVGGQTYVIDPSLFNGPVTQATWAGVQGDPHPTLIPSPASTFWRNQNPIVRDHGPHLHANQQGAEHVSQRVARAIRRRWLVRRHIPTAFPAARACNSWD